MRFEYLLATGLAALATAAPVADPPEYSFNTLKIIEKRDPPEYSFNTLKIIQKDKREEKSEEKRQGPPGYGIKYLLKETDAKSKEKRVDPPSYGNKHILKEAEN